MLFTRHLFFEPWPVIVLHVLHIFKFKIKVLSRTYRTILRDMKITGFVTEDTSTSHSRRSTGVNNQINSGWILFSCFSLRVLVSVMLAHSHGLLGHLNRAEPPLMSSIVPLLFLLWQIKVYAVKRGLFPYCKRLCCLCHFYPCPSLFNANVTHI